MSVDKDKSKVHKLALKGIRSAILWDRTLVVADG